MSLALGAGIALAIAGIVFRPFGIAEAWWTCAGALVAVAGGTLSPGGALAALARGDDVYAFLIGMMLLAEVARRDGLFEWFAAHAVRGAGTSAPRLFALVYGVGVGVTALLSNDATAVVLTPAVLAAVKRAKLNPQPYAYACAFVANAASFVFPISNPANLVLYGSRLPSLGAWLARFGIPAVLSIAATYLAMRLLFARELRERVNAAGATAKLSLHARLSAGAIGAAALAILTLSIAGRPVGLGTLACAAVVLLFSLARDRAALRVLRDVQWNVVPMVAGLFVLVGAVERAGGVASLHGLAANPHPSVLETLGAAGATVVLCNVVNNLPVGLIAAAALEGARDAALRDAVVVAVDLGPNLTVTGSLATVLWLAALRREGVAASPLQFFRFGTLVGLPALVASAFAASVLAAANAR